MRFFITIAAVVLAATTLTTKIAEACGGSYEYRPPTTVHLVSTHGERAFIVLAETTVPKHTTWQFLDQQYTYVATRVAELAPLSAQREFTLVGPSGLRVVRTDRHVALANQVQFGGKPHAALEVPAGDFRFAISGRVTDAKWHALDAKPIAASSPYTYSARAIRTIAGTDLQTVELSVYGKPQTIVRQRGRVIARTADTVAGAITFGGQLYLVTMQGKTQLVTVALPATAPAPIAKTYGYGS